MYINLSRVAVGAAAAVWLTGHGAPARADEAPAVQAIVVTAQLREQPLTDVPLAVTAYTGQTLELRGVQTFEQLAPFVPGLLVRSASPAASTFVIRGVSSDSGEATVEPRVSVFQDGVSISKSRGSSVELFDLERVEVAKGPQSTLYGRGALIGGINLIQNKARPGVFQASARAESGNAAYWMGEAMINAPAGERMAVRLAGRVKRRQGYVDNLLGGKDFNGVRSQAYRAALAWAVDDNLRLDLIGNYQKDGNDGTGFRSLIYRQTDPGAGQVLLAATDRAGAALNSVPGFEGKSGPGINRQVWGVTGLARWTIGPGLSLTSTSAYRRFDSLAVFDGDGASLPVLTAAEDARGRQISQELRLNLEAGPRLTGVAGAAWFHEQGSQRTPAQLDERLLLARFANALNGGPASGRPASDPAPLAAFGSTALLAQMLQGFAAGSGVALAQPLALGIAANLKPAQLDTTTNFSETDAADLFGDLTFRATHRFEVGAGLRYTASRKTTGLSAQTLSGRSVFGGVLAALNQPAGPRQALLAALAAPGAAALPTSAAYPVPVFSLAYSSTPGGAVQSQRLRDDGFSWRATARYSLSPRTQLYANYGRGRRPAVLAAGAPTAPGGDARFSVAPAETVDSIEAGAKTVARDGRLRFELAAFRYGYENFQTRVQQGAVFITSNAGKARSYGVEGQASYVVRGGVELFATYAFNHSRFVGGVRDGNRLRLSPDHSLSLAATARAQLLGGKLEARPAYVWQSKMFFDDDNDRPELQQVPRLLVADTVQDEVQKGYGLFNLRLGFTPAAGRWSLGLFVNNLFDQRYYRDAGNSGKVIGMPTFVAGEPRFYGLTLAIRS